MTDGVFNLADLDGTNGFVIRGVENLNESGRSVSGAGDVNGDGLDDIIIGANSSRVIGNESSIGESYVVFGSTDGFEATLELSDLDGNNGFVLRGLDLDDLFGRSVSGAGDVNGDGLDDIIIGAPRADVSGNYSDEGESYVVFGSTDGFNATLELSDLDGSNGFVFRGADDRNRAGNSVSGAGDVNGDGLDDIVIGSPNARISPNNRSGESYVVFGSTDGFNAVLEPSDLDGNNGFVLRKINNSGGVGRSVSDAGDINGDGIDDIIIGTYGPGEGESYIVFGSNDGFEAILELSDLDGTNGFVLQGVDFGDRSGESVSGAGDVNGDGLDDIIIGAPRAEKNVNRSYTGASYVVFGSTDGFPEIFELSDLDGSNGFVFRGAGDRDRLGNSVSAAGDVNGDGIDDIIVSASRADLSGYRSDQGESYVIFGSTDGFDAALELSDLDGSNGFVLPGIDKGDFSGFSVSGAGDVNGDGVDDLIISAPLAEVSSNGRNQGETYVIFGVKSVEITGTNEDDVLNGENSNDNISGLNGNDTISGGRGNDTISGGGDNDNIIGGIGRDNISGGDGNDNIQGGSGADNILGEAGNDILIGNNGQDTISGGDGDDQIRGGSGEDNLAGNQGNDTIFGGFGRDTIDGGDGDDNITGNSGYDDISGGAGNDLLNGGAGNDRLSGVDLSTFGVGEMDTLQGGVDADIFVLGNAEGVFYNDGDALTTGEADFALVRDFNQRRDVIELSGSIDLYRLDFVSGSTGNTNAEIVYTPGNAATGELIAVLENVSEDLSLSDVNFRFVV